MATTTEDKQKLAKASKVDDLRFNTPKDLTYEQLIRALDEAKEVVPASEFGTGFNVLGKEEKGRLVGVPFVILDYTINEGDFGAFVSLKVMTNGGEKLIVNDGSTGIAKQMEEIAARGETRAIFVKKGLRRSDYDYTDKDGSKKPATTFYLDTSA